MDAVPYLITFAVGFISQFIGTTVGGVGLFVVPVLIFLGLPPHTAIATCRIGLLAGNATSWYRFHKEGKVNYQIGIPLTIISAAGAFIGARALVQVSGPLLEKIFGFFVLAIVFFTLFHRDLGVVRRPKPTPLLQSMGYILLFLIGVMGAFFSAGTGLLGRGVLIYFYGQTFLESAGTRKIQGAAIGWTSAITFALSGIVNWHSALILALGMGIGSYFGAAYAMKKGDAWVRKLFIVIVIFSAIELLL